MRKNIGIIIASVLCSVSLSASEPILPLKPIGIPFAQKETKNDEKTQFTPQITGNRIVSGNKEFQISESGLMQIFCSGNSEARLFFSFILKDLKQSGKTWINIDGGRSGQKYMSKEKTAFQKEGKKFTFKTEVKIDESPVPYEQNVELMEDGRIKVSVKWDELKSQEKELTPASFIIRLPSLSAQKESIIVNGSKYNIPDEPKSNFFILERKKRETAMNAILNVFPEKAERCFDISIENCRCVTGTVRSGENYFDIYIYADSQQRELVFYIDLRKGINGKESNTKAAGIDFMAIENMDIPDRKATCNLIPNPSFEQGMNYFWLYGGGDYNPEKLNQQLFSVDSSKAKFGTCSLKMKSKIEKRSGYRLGWTPRFASFPVPLDAGKYTFSFYAAGSNDKDEQLGVWVPDIKSPSVAVKDVSKVFNLSKNWERYSFTFDIPASMPAIFLFGVSSTRGGDIWIDGLQLEKGDKVAAFSSPPAEGRLLTSNPFNFLSAGDEINAGLEIISKPGAKGKVKVSVKDFFGDELYSESFGFKCLNDGKCKIQLPFDGKFSKGIFIVKCEYELEDGQKTYGFFRFSIMDFLENKHRLKNIFAENYGESFECQSDFFEILERCRKIGIGSKCHVSKWEKEVTEAYLKYGIGPTDAIIWKNRTPKGSFYNIWENGTPNAGKLLLKDFRELSSDAVPSPEYLKELENVVSELVKTHPWIRCWSYFGEGTIVKNGKNDYNATVPIVMSFYNAVKKANPSALVFNGDPSNMRPDGGIRQIDELLEAVNGKIKFDYIGIHPYRESPENPDLDGDIQELLNVLKKHGYKDTPVFFPEGMHWGPYNIPQWNIVSASWTPPKCWYFGALSYDMGWSEKISAAWRARSWLVALKYQDFVKSFMSAASGNNLFMDINLTPFATQKISNTLGRLLGNAYFRKDIKFAPYTRCYIFEDEQKRPLAAIWNFHPKMDAGMMKSPFVSVSFPGGQKTEIFDLMEAKRTAETNKDGTMIFPISSFPVFFRGEPGTSEQFIKAFEKASIASSDEIAPVFVAGKPASPEILNMTISNILPRDFEGTIDVPGTSQSFKAAPSSSLKLKAKLPEKIPYGKIVAEKIKTVIFERNGKGKFENDISFNALLCLKAKNDFAIDGNPDDWKNIPQVDFNERWFQDKNISKISDADFSGWFKCAWNEKGIYLCVKIIDDKFVHENFSQMENRWNNDCLQVYFDTLCDARLNEKKGYDNNDYDYAVFPDSQGESSIVYRFYTPDCQVTEGVEAPRANTIAEDIQSAFKRTKDGYVYEVMFPARYLLPVQLEKGYALGFALFVADRDDISQVKPREKKVKSALTLTPDGTGCCNNPHLWPVMLLWE